MNDDALRATYAMDGHRDLESVARTYLPRVERLALHMADTYGRLDPSELVSASHVALWETIQRYNPAKADLHRYIMVTVRQRLLDVIRKDSPLDHRQWQRLQQLRQTERRLSDESGQAPTDDQLAEAMSISRERLDDLYRMEAQAASPVPIESIEVQDREEAVDDRVALQTTLEAALQKLPEREQRILYAVYVAGYTTDEVAKVLGMDASWVRRLRGRALSRLRADLTEPPAGRPETAPTAKKGDENRSAREGAEGPEWREAVRLEAGATRIPDVPAS